MAGRIASASQVTGLLAVVTVTLALQRYGAQALVTWLGGWVPVTAVVAQLPFTGALWLPVYILLQPRTMRAKDLLRAACAMFVLWCCLTVSENLEMDQRWAMVGEAFGLVLDLLRRRGRHAEWRKLTLSAIHYTRHGVLDTGVQASVDDFVVDPLTCPLLSESVPRVFISYSTRSEWSSQRARLLADVLTDQGTTVFLDRMFIDKGMNWHRELRRRISDSNVFISIADSLTTTREWTARELETALRGRALTGTPYTLVLRRKETVVNDDTLPAFRTVLDMERQLPCRLEVIDWNESTSAESIRWMLQAGQFSGAAVLPPQLSKTIQVIGTLFVMIAGSIGWIAGLFVVPLLFAGQLPNAGFSRLMMVLAMSVWLGFVGRMTLAFAAEVRPRRVSAAWVHACAALGFFIASATHWPDMGNALRAWAGLSILSGWLLAGWGLEMRLSR